MTKSLQIRMEAIGGQGANSAGKILAETAVLAHGFSGQHFSSYGSEKRGSPVKSHVRIYFDGRPVRSSAPILEPDILVVFHPNLLKYHPETLQGITSKTKVLVQSGTRDPQAILFPVGTRAGKIAAVDAMGISKKLGCGINAPLLGALLRWIPEISRVEMTAAFERFFIRISPEKKEKNRLGIERGFENFFEADYLLNQAVLEPITASYQRPGWSDAPIGGAILDGGNTVMKDNSGGRSGTIPNWNPEICINCARCDSVCPDYCFVWKMTDPHALVPQLQGIAYQYCKGCQKCIQACPTHALTLGVDTIETRLRSEEDKYGYRK